MKKLIIKSLWRLSVVFVAVISCVVITSSSCEPEPKPEPKPESNEEKFEDMIVGVWSDDGDVNWYEAPTKPSLYGGSSYGFEFRANGQCYKHGSSHGSGRYQIIDDQLIITYTDAYADKYTIEKLTTKVLEIVWIDDEEPDEWYNSETYYRVK